MLDIWTLQDQATAEAFCQLHFEETKERLDATQLKLYLSEECPYDGYSLVRLELSPQIIDSETGRRTISSRCVSYALYRKTNAQTPYAIVPLTRTSANIYHTNGVLKFGVTTANFLRYIVFYGHVVNNPPFYFVYRLPQLIALCQHLKSDIRDRITSAVTSNFRAQPNGDLVIPLEKADYPLLGNTFTFRIPCFHNGNLFVTKMKISADGMPEMIEDQPLQIEGVFDEEANYNYHPLDFSSQIATDLAAFARRSKRARILTVGTLTLDNLLQVWILPLFGFHLFVLLALGLTGTEIFAYFEKLKESTLLTISAAVVGTIGTIIAVFRYVFLEVTNYLRKLVPSVWSSFAAAVEQESKKQLAALGYLIFFSLSALEHSLKLLMTLSLLLYALSKALPSLLLNLNFGQCIVSVINHLPVAGDLTKTIFEGTPFAPVVLPGISAKVLTGVVSFLFSTILLGLLTRIFLLTRAKN